MTTKTGTKTSGARGGTVDPRPCSIVINDAGVVFGANTDGVVDHLRALGYSAGPVGHVVAIDCNSDEQNELVAAFIRRSLDATPWRPLSVEVLCDDVTALKEECVVPERA